jgi:N-acetylmuramoyl-L-alanine amidase
MVRLFLCGLLVFGGACLRAETLKSEALAYALSTRYAPNANWASVVELEALADREVSRYWRPAATIQSARAEDALPLVGLHLAIDPGHIGGRWAAYEWRDFAVAEGDFRVREGELVLEVAQRVRAQLQALGAKVTLVRETYEPVNPKPPTDYLERALAELPLPKGASLAELLDHGHAVQFRAIQMAIIEAELVERARLVNEVIQPDALISLHINAAPWPEGEAPRLQLVDSNHVHVLIFGCLSDKELSSPRQQAPMLTKLTNGSGEEERLLGRALGAALAETTTLPPSKYWGTNAVLLDPDASTVWARNLLLLRMVECPTVLLEPHVANSKVAYARIQKALATRAEGAKPDSDDILVEYADAVVAGVLGRYRSDFGE